MIYLKIFLAKVIKKRLVLGFFYGFSQGSLPKGGMGGILHISPTYNISFKFVLGSGIDNLCELVAQKLLLMLAQEQGIS
jgi:hypothetical protein